jgi:predicted neutral ceramidase superfamily lipid hydrolase
MAILPWYAAAMLPLALANVLVNHLLARSDYRVVRWLVGLAVLYVLGLLTFHATPIQILQVLGVACTVMFLICLWFVRHPLPLRTPATVAEFTR